MSAQHSGIAEGGKVFRTVIGEFFTQISVQVIKKETVFIRPVFQYPEALAGAIHRYEERVYSVLPHTGSPFEGNGCSTTSKRKVTISPIIRWVCRFFEKLMFHNYYFND